MAGPLRSTGTTPACPPAAPVFPAVRRPVRRSEGQAARNRRALRTVESEVGQEVLHHHDRRGANYRKGISELCRKLTDKGFHVELQSNLISKHVKEFVDTVDPAKVGQIMASYHGWKLDKSEATRNVYMENFRYATERGFSTVLKTIVPPWEIDGIEAKVEWLKQQIPPVARSLPGCTSRGRSIPTPILKESGRYFGRYGTSERIAKSFSSGVGGFQRHALFRRGGVFRHGLERAVQAVLHLSEDRKLRS